MIINHNASAVSSYRSLKFNQMEVDKSMAKLSSGMRINRAGDDPSGLAVSEKLRTQIQGLRQAERNTADGLSFIQTTEGFLAQTSDIVQRIRVLAVQSSNGIYSAEDRQMIQVEVSQLIDEVDRVASQAEFNQYRMLLGEFSRTSQVGSMFFHMGPNANQRERVYIGTMTAQALKLKGDDGVGVTVSSPGDANAAIARADEALSILLKQRADLGGYANRLEQASKGLMNAYENMAASESRIRDTDMAERMSSFTRYQILVQAATAMVAQSNMRSQTVLQLLR